MLRMDRTVNQRQALISDLPELVTLLADAKAQMSRAGFHQWTPDYPNPALLARDVAEGHLWLFGAGVNATVTVTTTPDAWTMHRLMVRSTHSHRGLASQMTAAVVTAAGAAGARRVTTMTHHDNVAVQRLLIGQGFTETGRQLVPGRIAFGEFVTYTIAL